MTASKRWVIGSSPECDVVITRSNVSRKHCRLILDEGRFLLEDMHSTNGTFVNGKQVTGRVEVTREDQILLGREVRFQWPDDALQKRIRIGRDPENDIVLDFEMVSGRHAVLTILGQKAILEDIGSTNGTAINSPENKIQKHPLGTGDVVYFGSLRVPAERLFTAASKRAR